MRFSGTEVKRRREGAALTQAALARRMCLGGVGSRYSPAHVSAWERGQNAPGSVALYDLAHALGCEMGELYEEHRGAPIQQDRGKGTR